jgi:MFS family permease
MSHTPRSSRANIRRLATGRLISVTGGAAAYTALNFTIWDKTHSPAIQALSLLLTFGITGIVGPFAGALGDRFDRRKVMIWSEAVAAAFFVAMAFTDSPAWLIGLAFGSAIAELPFFAASRAAIPNLIGDESELSWANSLVTIGVHAGIAIGPVIGGVLLAVSGPSWVFAINAISYLISLWLTVSIRVSFQERPAGDTTGTEHEGISAGVRFLWRDRVVRRMAAAWLIFLLGMGIGMVADAALSESFATNGHIPFLWFSISVELGFALLITGWGTGSVIGSATGRWMTARTEPAWLVGGAFGIAVAAFGVGTATVFPLVLASLLAMGTCDGFTIVAENGIMQRRTPDEVRSRVLGAFDAVLSLGLAVAYLVAGPVLEAVGPRWAYRIGGFTAGLAAIALLPLLRLRREAAPSMPDEVEPAEPGRVAQGMRFTSAEELEGGTAVGSV